MIDIVSGHVCDTVRYVYSKKPERISDIKAILKRPATFLKLNNVSLKSMCP